MDTTKPTAPRSLFTEGLDDATAFFLLTYLHEPADNNWAHYYDARYGNGGSEAATGEISALHQYIAERAEGAIRTQTVKRFPAGTPGYENNRGEMFGVVMSELLRRDNAESRMNACYEGRATIASIAGKLSSQKDSWEPVLRGTKPTATGAAMRPDERAEKERKATRVEHARAALAAADTDSEVLEAEALLEQRIREANAVNRLAYADPGSHAFQAHNRDFDDVEYDPIGALEDHLDATLFGVTEVDEAATAVRWFDDLTAGVITVAQREALVLVARLDNESLNDRVEHAAVLALLEAMVSPTDEARGLAEALEGRVTGNRTQPEVASIIGISERQVRRLIADGTAAIFADDALVRALRRGVDGTRRVTVGEIGRAIANQFANVELDEPYLTAVLDAYGYEQPNRTTINNLRDATIAAQKKAKVSA